MQITWIHAIIKNNKGKETDTAEERREDTWQPAAKQGTETKTPQKNREGNTAARSATPTGSYTGKTAGASHREGANPTPEPPFEGKPTNPNPTPDTKPRTSTTTLWLFFFPVDFFLINFSLVISRTSSGRLCDEVHFFFPQQSKEKFKFCFQNKGKKNTRRPPPDHFVMLFRGGWVGSE